MLEKNPYQNLFIELRRGSLTLAVLGCLKKPHYGYALLESMKGIDIEIEANTLYPLLRRLESQGLLGSDWDISESRPRKYYVLSEKGKEVLEMLLNEWKKIQDSIDRIPYE